MIGMKASNIQKGESKLDLKLINLYPLYERLGNLVRRIQIIHKYSLALLEILW